MLNNWYFHKNVWWNSEFQRAVGGLYIKINYYIPHCLLNAIAHQHPNSNGIYSKSAVDIRPRISNYFPKFYVGVITHPCSEFHVVFLHPYA